MYKILKNGLVEKVTEENRKTENFWNNTIAIVFQKQDTEMIREVFGESQFKYRPFCEYKFSELSYYKIYNTMESYGEEGEELYNICRLTPCEVEILQDNYKISKILIEEMGHEKFDKIIFGFNPDEKIIEENDSYILQESIYDDGDIENKAIRYHFKNNQQKSEFNYKDWYKSQRIQIFLNEFSFFSPDENKYCIKTNNDNFDYETIDERMIKNIRKFLTENFDYINSEVIITTDKEELHGYAMLTYDSMEHSWAGSETHKESAITIFGNIEFGKYEHYIFSENGNTTIDEEKENLPNFKIESDIVFAKKIRSHSDYNNNYYDEIEKKIIIYLGK